MFGSKPKCITPGGARHCTNANCPERKAFYALMRGVVDPYLGAEMPVRFTSSYAIYHTLNVMTPNEGNGYRQIKGQTKLKRLNRRARGRFVIVWNHEKNEQRQAAEHRSYVTHWTLSDFVVRGEPSVKDMTRIKRIVEKYFGVTGFFVSTMKPFPKQAATLAQRALVG